MEKLVLILLSMFAMQTTCTQEIKWMTFEEALVKQKENPKPIFMYTVGYFRCSICDKVETDAFRNEAVVSFINEKYYPVKFEGEGNSVIDFHGTLYDNPKYNPNSTAKIDRRHQFTKKILKTDGYPSSYIINEKGDVSKSFIGYQKPEILLEAMKG